MTPYPFKVQKNDPARKGELAGRKMLFNGSRYAVAPVHTRFDAVQWFVWDAEAIEIPDGAKTIVIRQEETYEAAVSGLNQ